jgi:hypothetical protein
LICFVKKIHSRKTDFFIIRIISLVGFEAFLTSMVAKEVETLPRGIYHSSLRRQGAAANQGKAIGSIPSFLLSQYQKTRQPGLRPGHQKTASL